MSAEIWVKILSVGLVVVVICLVSYLGYVVVREVLNIDCCADNYTLIDFDERHPSDHMESKR